MEEEDEALKTRIREAVVDMLKGADLEDLTEFKVRAAASDRLGVDLSGDLRHRQFVREVLEAYLLSSVNDAERREDVDLGNGKVGAFREGSQFICKLSNRRNVTVQDFQGKSLVSIRDYYQKDGKQLPSTSGISLTTEQWSVLRTSIPAIEEAVSMMRAKMRTAVEDQPNMPSSDKGTPSRNEDQPIVPSSDIGTPSNIEELVPVKVDRFDGKNYHSWTSQMELFLKQLKIEYVLADPCPSDNSCTEASSQEVAVAKVARQKWLNDDYLCRHNILNSLSDALYDTYSTKGYSANELWEDLKFFYLDEVFGSKRTQVKKYIEFQMVDGKSIVGQVQELNCIADSLVASGHHFDENFHVSTVVSKLPPSWRDFSIKLMREEYLPFRVMMDRVRVEEESRRPVVKQGEIPSSAYSHPPQNIRPSIRDLQNPRMQWRRQEMHADSKPMACFFCGKTGHLIKTCPIKKYKEANGSCDKENSAASQSQSQI